MEADIVEESNEYRMHFSPKMIGADDGA